MFKRLSNVFASWGMKAVLAFIFEKVVLPIGMPALTLLFGYLNEVNLFYIWIGFLASLAFVFHWLVKLNEWRYKTKVKNKIAISGLEGFIDSEGKYGVQLQLANMAEFPIDFRVTQLELKLGDRVPSEEDRVLTSQIPAHGHGWKNSGTVIVENKVSSNVKGRLKFIVEYGKNGIYNESIDGTLNIDFFFNEYGEFQIGWSEGVANEQG